MDGTTWFTVHWIYSTSYMYKNCESILIIINFFGWCHWNIIWNCIEIPFHSQLLFNCAQKLCNSVLYSSQIGRLKYSSVTFFLEPSCIVRENDRFFHCRQLGKYELEHLRHISVTRTWECDNSHTVCRILIGLLVSNDRTTEIFVPRAYGWWN